MGVELKDLSAGVWWVRRVEKRPAGPALIGSQVDVRIGMLFALGKAPFLECQVIWFWYPDGASGEPYQPKRPVEFCKPASVLGLEVLGRVECPYAMGQMTASEFEAVKIGEGAWGETKCETIDGPDWLGNWSKRRGKFFELSNGTTLADAVAAELPPLWDEHQEKLRLSRIEGACRDGETGGLTRQEEDFVRAWRAKFRKAVAATTFTPPIPPYHELQFDPSNPQPPSKVWPGGVRRIEDLEPWQLRAAGLITNGQYEDLVRDGKAWTTSNPESTPQPTMTAEPSREPGLITKWMEIVESAWGIIANAGGGDWTKESADWREAAGKWRDEYHARLWPLIRKHKQMQSRKPGLGQTHAAKVNDEAASKVERTLKAWDFGPQPDPSLPVAKPEVAREFDIEYDEDGRLTEDEYETVVKTMQEIVETNVNPMSPRERQSFMQLFKEKMRAITKPKESQYSGERVSVPLAEIKERFNIKSPFESFTVNLPSDRKDFHGMLFGRAVHLVPDGETGWKPKDPEAFKASGLEMVGGSTVRVAGEKRAAAIYPGVSEPGDDPFEDLVAATTQRLDGETPRPAESNPGIVLDMDKPPFPIKTYSAVWSPEDNSWRKQLRYEDQANGRFVVGTFEGDGEKARFWQLCAETMEWMCLGGAKAQPETDESATFARKFEAKAAINTCKKPPFMVQQ